MRPPGPRADSKSVTEIPFFASVDAHTAPDTATFNPFLSAIFSISKYILCMSQTVEIKTEERDINLLPPPTTATLVATLLMVVVSMDGSDLQRQKGRSL